MTYVCIKCRKIWIRGECSDEPSGGLCLDCATDYIRMKQKQKGLHDCFRRSTEICTKVDCSYWSCCNKDSLAVARSSKAEYPAIEQLVA
ncbi:MAG: hypothetical protein H6Q51_1901 [Deltaproteobacteria bacterium]|nr:hypothetical protein [Deltaproteobacteria bacterium]